MKSKTPDMVGGLARSVEMETNVIFAKPANFVKRLRKSCFRKTSPYHVFRAGHAGYAGLTYSHNVLRCPATKNVCWTCWTRLQPQRFQLKVVHHVSR